MLIHADDTGGRRGGWEEEKRRGGETRGPEVMRKFSPSLSFVLRCCAFKKMMAD